MIQPYGAADWRRLRDLRLEMLARRRGYHPTGATEPYSLDPTHSELELRLRL